MAEKIKVSKKLKAPLTVPVINEQVTENVIIHDPSLCTGCMQCMVGCAYSHYKTYDIKYAFLYVNEDPAKIGSWVNANCSHCVYPMCLAACPRDAIYKDDLGIVRISPMMCIGCGVCSQACPIAMPRLDAAKKIYAKCDFCNGEFPNCVKMCSTNALTLLTRQNGFDYVKKMRGV
jgi:Fe-S-cluster-containing dehydrogenase component